MEPQQDRSRATRLRLLTAAIECLGELGWSNSTVTVVAERAGVSRGAAQHHFPTREDLFVAAVEHVSEIRASEVREFTSRAGAEPLDTRAVVDLVVELYTGSLFRAALELWVASSAEPQLRERVVPLEAKIGRDVHQLTVQLLDADESVPGVRELIQATLDLARGLGLSNLLTDDRKRREAILAQWAVQLEQVIRPSDPAL
ncbi:MAG TPA: TetR/AcrR family transcriptional regulator [Microthrixaceae bacterium]|nr:TetR/AcrR family transcriptional regulator [Microthrixaceae bacterium]